MTGGIGEQLIADVAPRMPWFKFFPSDWKGDELLSMCSLAARGLLTEFLCLMHHATPYGHLVVNGKPPTDAELVRLVRAASPREMRRLRAELLERGVLSQTKHGVLFSRRMVRAADESALGRKNGKLGGNPKLRPRLRLTPRLTDGDKTQIPDARSQNPLPPKGDGDDQQAFEIADAMFDRFWLAWPSPRKNRRNARLCWRRIRPLPDEAFTHRVIQTLERHKASRDWQKDGGRYIPMPSTWINGERWNDEIDTTDSAARLVAGADETARYLAEHRKAGGRA